MVCESVASLYSAGSFNSLHRNCNGNEKLFSDWQLGILPCCASHVGEQGGCISADDKMGPSPVPILIPQATAVSILQMVLI